MAAYISKLEGVETFLNEFFQIIQFLFDLIEDFIIIATA